LRMKLAIRDIRISDERAWRPLWDGYLQFYETELAKATTDATWRRLLDPAIAMSGIVAERGETLVGDHSPDLLIQNRGSAQLSALGEVEQFVIGNAAPQEEREARRQLELADSIRLIARDVGRFRLDAEQELRRHDQPHDSLLDAAIEVPFPAPLAIERDQRLDVGIGHRPPKGTARECLENRSRAGDLFRFNRTHRRNAAKAFRETGMTGEDPLPAR